MTLTRNRVMALLIAAVIFGVDQWVKHVLVWQVKLAEMEKIEILPFFDLRFTQNYGISLGLLTAESSEARWLLVLMTGAIALGVVVWILRETARADLIGLALVLGGALGNIRDRMKFGYVVDYADLHFGTFRPFLIFNIADAAITIGVLIILARSFLSREKPENPANIAPES